MKNFRRVTNLLLIIVFFSGCQKNKIPVHDVNQGGFVLDWNVIGPFPTEELTDRQLNGANRSGYNTDFLISVGGENQAILYEGLIASYQKKNGVVRNAVVKRIGPDRDKNSLPAFRRIINNNQHILDRDFDKAVAYAFCYLESDKPQKIFAHLDVDGSPKVWLNDQLVYEKWEDFSKSIRLEWYYNFELDLKKGLNRFLIKVDNIEGWWGFRIELYPEDQNNVLVKSDKPKTIKIDSLALSKQDLSFVINSSPGIPGKPVEVVISNMDGEEIHNAQYITGQPISVDFVKDFNGPVTINAVMNSQPENTSVKEVFWLGDLEKALDLLNKKYVDTRDRYAPYLPERVQGVYDHLFMYCDRVFRASIPKPDLNLALNYNFIGRLVDYLEKGKDILSENPGEAFPLLFHAMGYGNKEITTWAHVSVPLNYGKEVIPCPVVFILHGSGGFGKEIAHWPKANSTIEATGDPVIVIRPYAPSMSEHLEHNGWDPVFLDNYLIQARQIFDIDEERIYVLGGSGGGKGTWRWINHSTEHFAAAIPIVAGDGIPFRAEKLKYLPIWIINGDDDLASYPFLPEVTVNRLRSIGSDVAFTNFPGLGHSVSPGYNKIDLKKWLLAHKNPHRIGHDPLFDMSINKDGYSKVTFKQFSDKVYVGLTDKENPLYPQDNIFRAAMKIYQAYRNPNSFITERMAEGYALIYEEDHHIDDNKEILLDAPDQETGKSGYLRTKKMDACKVASFYVRCPDNWDTFSEIKNKLADELRQEGYELTNEVFNYMLTITGSPERYWQVCFVLQE